MELDPFKSSSAVRDPHQLSPLNICTAMCHSNRGIGLGEGFPWPSLKGDYEYYTHLTQWTSDPSKKVVQIKGRRTWMLTTEKEKEAASVINVIISSTLREDSHRSLHKVVSSFDEAVDYALSGPRRHEIEAVWVMGGTRVYANAINHPLCKRLYLTRVFGNFDADVFFPEFENKFRKISLPNVDGEPREDNGVRYQFEVYERLRDILRLRFRKKHLVFCVLSFMKVFANTDEPRPLPDIPTTRRHLDSKIMNKNYLKLTMEGIQTSDESALLKRYHDSLVNALGNRTEETKIPNPNRYEERQDNLRRACGSMPGRQKTLRSLHTLWYMDTHKMLYCSVAKSGSSFWRRTWKALSAYEGKDTSPYKFAHSEFRSEYYRLDIINATKSAETGFSLSQLLETSFKYIFTRDPYTRIFSAYVDKFLAPNKYLWKQIGKKIAKSRDLASDKSLRCGHDVTFREFVKYIIRTPRRRLDDHFIPVSSVCDVCNLQYDVVAKMETFREDVSYIFRHLNVDKRIKFKDFAVEHTVDSVVDYVTRAFSQRERISSCVSFHTALRRLWRQMQILGIISKQEDFPLAPEQSEASKQIEVINLALEAHWRSGDTSKSNKMEAFLQAYHQISIEELEALRKKYQKDFLLFGYDDRPQMLFQNFEQLDMTFDYFDVLNE
ncbi:uncharacterized protein [Haliotis asinina]|uniref:uncharacterized protein n=1 Tax=Haliotis asinina TaxID=109174 RepID=UPI00353264BD